ncbi:lytic murein transglycosylase, partial [Cribrihabitans sp. XS_ASV171]
MIDRRIFSLGLGASVLAACSGGGTLQTTPSPDPQFRTVPNDGWDRWVAAFKPRAAAQGISQSTLDRAFRNAGYIPLVIERDRNQTEFKRSLEDYLAIAASDERVATGRQMLQRHNATLSR